MQVKIRQLRAFDAIVRLGSFVEAARALHVTPAALSLALRELEEVLGFKVLERTTRNLRLSDAGRGYLAFAQRTLAELEGAERFAREVQQGHAVVRVATTQAIVITLLAAALPEVNLAFPRVRLFPLDVATSSIADALASRHADIAIGVGLPSDDEFEAVVLFESRWFGYVSARHRLGRRRRLSWADLANERLFMNKSSHLKLAAALGQQVVFSDVQETTTVTSGFAMASTGLGVAVFPAYAQPLAQVSGIKALPIAGPVLPHDLMIGTARQPTTSAPLHAIRDALIGAIQARCGHLR